MRTYMMDDNDWTVVKPTGLQFYVDPATGNDANVGTCQAPLKTFAAAYKKVNANGAIWIQRGTTLVENPLGQITIPGLTIGTYGNLAQQTRPIWQLDYSKPMGVLHLNGDGQSLLDIDFHSYLHTPGDAQFPFMKDSPTGPGITVGGTDVLIEGCRAQGFFQNYQIVGSTRLTIRRCQGINAFSSNGGHAAGMYTDDCTDLVLDEVILSGNGWCLQDMTVTAPAFYEFNHGLYADDGQNELATNPHPPMKPITMKNSMIANSAGCGIEMRPGGTLTNTLFVNASCAGMDIVSGGTNPLITNNVFTDSIDSPADQSGTGNALGLGGLAGSASGNYFINGYKRNGGAVSITYTKSNAYDYTTATSLIVGNVVSNWHGWGIKSETYRDTVILASNTISAEGPAVGIVNGPKFWGTANNVHQTVGQPVPVYHEGGVNISAAVYLHHYGETAFHSVPAYVDPTRTIERYIHEVVQKEVGGQDGTFKTLNRYMIATRKGWCPSCLRPQNVIAWLTAGYQPKIPVASPTAQLSSIAPFKVV